jgi:glutamyl/glutaminyl-tRNA synthetase
MEGIRKAGCTRLAPTPSGCLHTGNALNFLLTERLARSNGARVLLRIDDLDAERVRPEYLEDIFRSLEWLGIAWDEGPSGPDDFRANWSQQLRLHHYHALLGSLRDQGVLYACDCSRSALRDLAPDGRYTGTCRDRGLELDAPDVTWRLNIGEAAVVQVPDLFGKAIPVDLVQNMGDPVLRQRNGRPAYQLASLADDVQYGITFIVRGKDLLPSSACQLHIARLLGLSTFGQVRFLHHPLITDEAGQKLSKSAGATSLKAMREAGVEPSVLHAQADRMLETLVAQQ